MIIDVQALTQIFPLAMRILPEPVMPTIPSLEYFVSNLLSGY
jgi:hypothetical protein